MTEPSGPARQTLTIGAVALVIFAIGWFVLSTRVAHHDARTAAGESLGAALGLLLFVSLIGAVRSRRRADRDDPDSARDDPDSARDE